MSWTEITCHHDWENSSGFRQPCPMCVADAYESEREAHAETKRTLAGYSDNWETMTKNSRDAIKAAEDRATSEHVTQEVMEEVLLKSRQVHAEVAQMKEVAIENYVRSYCQKCETRADHDEDGACQVCSTQVMWPDDYIKQLEGERDEARDVAKTVVANMDVPEFWFVGGPPEWLSDPADPKAQCECGVTPDSPDGPPEGFMCGYCQSMQEASDELPHIDEDWRPGQ